MTVGASFQSWYSSRFPLAAQPRTDLAAGARGDVRRSGDPGAEFTDIRGVEVSKNGNVLVLDYKARTSAFLLPMESSSR